MSCPPVLRWVAAWGTLVPCSPLHPHRLVGWCQPTRGPAVPPLLPQGSTDCYSPGCMIGHAVFPGDRTQYSRGGWLCRGQNRGIRSRGAGQSTQVFGWLLASFPRRGDAFLLTDWGEGLSVNTGFTPTSGMELPLNEDLGLQQENLVSPFDPFL